MRQAVGVVTLLVVLSACEGEATRAEFEQKQRSVDSLTRVVVAVMVKALDADPPSGAELGTAYVSACKGRDGGVFDHVDTFVTHRDIDPETSADAIVQGLRAAGLEPRLRDDIEPGLVRVELDGVTAEVSSLGQGQAGQTIFVGTGCMEVGEVLAGDLKAEPARTIDR